MVNPIRFIAGIALSVFLAAAAAQDDSDSDGKLYKWVDEDGNVTYQDRPPPEGGGQVETFVDPDAAIEAESEAALPEVDVTFYSIQECGACDLVRRLLQERGIPFQEKDAASTREVQDELKEVAGSLSVPALQIGDEEVIKGYNRDLLLNELEEAGFSISIADGEPSEQGTAAAGGTDGETEPAGEDTGSPAGDDEPDIFDEDIFAEENDGGSGDDVTGWEEIPEDERIEISQ